MEALPVLGGFQGFQNVRLVAFGVALKRFLPGLRFDGGGFFRKTIRPGFLHAVIDDKAVFPLQSAASIGKRLVIHKRIVSGQSFRMHHIIRNVKVEIIGVFVDTTMPLMLSKTQSPGKAFLYGLERLRCQLRLVLRPETDQQVIGLFSGAAGVQVLYGFGLQDAQIVIIP
jgi:hypothetical protein